MDSMLDEQQHFWILFPASLILLLNLSGSVWNKKKQLSEKKKENLFDK